MQTTLCFDFGNTRLKCGVFAGRDFKTEHVLENADTPEIRKLLDEYKPARSILSSVINHPPELEHLLAQHTHFHKLGHASQLPLTTPVGKPETIGADRLALVAAAVPGMAAPLRQRHRGRRPRPTSSGTKRPWPRPPFPPRPLPPRSRPHSSRSSSRATSTCCRPVETRPRLPPRNSLKWFERSSPRRVMARGFACGCSERKTPPRGHNSICRPSWVMPEFRRR